MQSQPKVKETNNVSLNDGKIHMFQIYILEVLIV